jgi:DNA repair exonuclease SbcCD nuclease subunit
VSSAVHDLLSKDMKDFKIYQLVGNHDSYFKNTIDVNSLKFMNNIPNINLIEEPIDLEFGDKKFWLVPWVTDYKKFSDAYMLKSAHVCIGHFDIIGSPHNKTSVCNENGMEPAFFLDRFKLTISGHYHRASEITSYDSKIKYIGNPYHLNRGDYGEKRGFTILDTDDLSTEFIENTTSIKYMRFNYPEPFKKKDITGNIIDVFVNVTKDYSEREFQMYISRMEKCEPVLTPYVRIEKTLSINEDDIDIEVGSTKEILSEYINQLKNIPEEEKKIVSSRLMDLYERFNKTED